MQESRGRQEKRSARNEAIFRRANDVLRERYSELGVVNLVPFLCECGDMRCTRTLRMALDEFDELRSNARRLAVVPGHGRAGIDAVVEHGVRYDVVEKRHVGHESR